MNPDAEWLEPDGRGGFASGTVGGARTRRYHALLLAATHPPVGRTVLVNGVEVWLETPGGRWGLSTQRYPGGADGVDVLAPRGVDHLVDFRAEPWPRWTFRLPDGTTVEQEVFVHRATGLAALGWRLPAPTPGVRLELRPLFSGRDYHALHQENDAFAMTPAETLNEGRSVLWQPYPGVPGVRVWSSGPYRHEPAWYRNFLYTEERARGLSCQEDLAVPGVFECDLARNGTASLLLAAVDPAGPAASAPPLPAAASAGNLLPALRADEERRRSTFRDPLRRAGDDYLARGGRGLTILAGYPWFTDWGRDTFISLRGLCLAAGRFDEAREILLTWLGTLSEGMIPNRFPDGGEAPEYNTADASLWFVVAAHDYLALVPRPRDAASFERHARDGTALLAGCETILAAHAVGTRHGLRADPQDGLLFAGEPGSTLALTWMDARFEGQAVTPRIGKPVEIQALWLNALALMAPHSAHWRALYERGRISFEEKFWNPERDCLFDVVDADNAPGKRDASLRPNQIFAVGGLPLVLLSPGRARAVVAALESALLTPMGLRTLAPGEPGYCPRYEGGLGQRDGAYHQGTAWPWLLGPFVEAWVRVRGDSAAIRLAARERFLDPLLASLPENVGIGHLPEITDADSPYTQRGCPFQAWSMGELTRLAFDVLR